MSVYNALALETQYEICDRRCVYDDRGAAYSPNYNLIRSSVNRVPLR